MKHLGISAEEKRDNYQHNIVSDAPKYPHGTRIYLDADTMKKLEMKVPKVGEKMMVLAAVEVVEVRKENNEGDVSKYCCELQITDMDIKESEENDKNNMDRAEAIYS